MDKYLADIPPTTQVWLVIGTLTLMPMSRPIEMSTKWGSFILKKPKRYRLNSGGQTGRMFIDDHVSLEQSNALLEAYRLGSNPVQQRRALDSIIRHITDDPNDGDIY